MAFDYLLISHHHLFFLGHTFDRDVNITLQKGFALYHQSANIWCLFIFDILPVLKYRRIDEEESLKDKLSKLSIHSITKKSKRVTSHLKILTGGEQVNWAIYQSLCITFGTSRSKGVQNTTLAILYFHFVQHLLYRLQFQLWTMNSRSVQ